MTITHRQGDLFASGLKALAHGVNCQGLMGAGIARQFAQRWPAMLAEYKALCARDPGLELGRSWYWPSGGWTIFNLATQFHPGPDARRWAIASALGEMTRQAQALGIRQVGLPMIGCGIGGLDPADLEACLAPFADAPVDLVVYEYKAEG